MFWHLIKYFSFIKIFSGGGGRHGGGGGYGGGGGGRSGYGGGGGGGGGWGGPPGARSGGQLGIKNIFLFDLKYFLPGAGGNYSSAGGSDDWW